ncbi:hypothetical protein PV10_06314 [Exophiala mesophila]|uniref:Major facilitator superfamily (MFS) profile domain-containing protein n=1 Tax=Exophiala mesophila TaxID=212818 RepID=A0A0D1ZAV9_EXOME|nr:uncharacterized protein PV10_06314 [Exophiala mesophila]KIV91817.1 hypothetical protein PV10_06314 [Exophiala mesophila]
MVAPSEAIHASGPKDDYQLNEVARSAEIQEPVPLGDEKVSGDHVESINAPVWDNEDEEPELHMRTWVALAAMVVLQFVMLLALQGPPAVLSYIGTSLDNTTEQSWISTALTLVQAVLAPIIASISDTFQARKAILIGACTLSFVGCAVAPGSNDLYRLIGAQIMIGFGFAAAPLGFAIPSEIVPRRWRPLSQGAVNMAGSLGAVVGPITIGALTRRNPIDGWRTFYWIQMGLWGFAIIGIFLGYRPPKRHTRFDHLTFAQKLGRTDFIGSGFLASGLTLLITGLTIGGNQFPWANARVVVLLVLGAVLLVGFGLWEWKGTDSGIFHHDFFRGDRDMARSFALCLFLMFLEGVVFFAYLVFYPVLTAALYETDPLLVVLRTQPNYMGGVLSALVWGYLSTRFRTIRELLSIGFLMVTGAMIGLATLQPDTGNVAIGMACLSGIGSASPLILIITAVQLSTPPHLIATATGVTTSVRSIGATMFTAVYSAALQTRTAEKIPAYVAKAAAEAGLTPASIPAFIKAIASGNPAALAEVPGVSPTIIGLGVAAFKQAFADSIRVVYIIAAPFSMLAAICSLGLASYRRTMNYKVDAPVEDLHAHHRDVEHK